MDENQKQEKLKNLAESLSEELGADNPNAPPPASPPAAPSNKSQEVAVDKILQSAPPSTSASKSSPPPVSPQPKADPTMAEIDKMFMDQDPDFLKTLEDVKQDIGTAEKDISIETIKIEDEDLSEQEMEPAVVASAPPKKTTKNIFLWPVRPFIFLFKKANQAGAWIWSYRRSLLSETKTLVLQLFSDVKGLFGEGIQWISRRSWIQRIQLMGLIFVLLFMGWAIRFISSGHSLLPEDQSLFLRSFELVASKVTTFDPSEPMEQFDSPLRHPEHIVLYKKMKVNLKPSSRSGGNPMAAFEVFLEASSQETAIELKDREMEFHDVISRVFEGLPYDDMTEIEGKNKLKLILRRDINKILNQGRVKKVYFKTLFYKP